MGLGELPKIHEDDVLKDDVEEEIEIGNYVELILSFAIDGINDSCLELITEL